MSALAQYEVLDRIAFSEHVRTDRPASGEIFRGFQDGKIDANPRLDDLVVWLPASNQALLCLVVETQDGQYYAEAAYSLGNRRSPNGYSVPFSTEYRYLLESRPIRDISILAFVASNCGQSRDRLYVPITRGNANMIEQPLIVLVNARTPSISVRVFHHQKRRYFNCTRDKTSERLVAFDTECIVTSSVMHGDTTLTIERYRGNKVLDPTKVEAYFP